MRAKPPHQSPPCPPALPRQRPNRRRPAKHWAAACGPPNADPDPAMGLRQRNTRSNVHAAQQDGCMGVVGGLVVLVIKRREKGKDKGESTRAALGWLSRCQGRYISTYQELLLANHSAGSERTSDWDGCVSTSLVVTPRLSAAEGAACCHRITRPISSSSSSSERASKQLFLNLWIVTFVLNEASAPQNKRRAGGGARDMSVRAGEGRGGRLARRS